MTIDDKIKELETKLDEVELNGTFYLNSLIACQNQLAIAIVALKKYRTRMGEASWAGIALKKMKIT